MNRLATLFSAFLVGCSSVPQQHIGEGTVQPIIVGTEADIERAPALAKTCKLKGTTVGKSHGHPTLYAQRTAVLSASQLHLPWECFISGLSSSEFSDHPGFVGTEAASPK
jgi:hypothetical protein